MNNISLNREPISLAAGNTYIIIDALYLDDVREALPGIDLSNIFSDIRKKFFPYTDTPFAEYIATAVSLDLDKLVRVRSEEIAGDKKSLLGTDTGLLLFINANVFMTFAQGCEYDKLVDDMYAPVSITYWQQVTGPFLATDVALVLLDGGGTYRIV